MSKTLKDLNIIDNFLFNELIMQEDTEKAKEFVRAILEPIINKKIRSLEFQGQRVLQGADVDKRGIEMDAYVKVYADETGVECADVELTEKPVIYDIEPNKYKSNDSKRSRLYHSLIDSKIAESGIKYSDLPDVYVIFILPYDPFDSDYMLYTTKNLCIENPCIPCDDGATTLFLYAYGTQNIPSQAVANMLKFIVDSSEQNAERANMVNVHSMVQNIKCNAQLGVKYMQSWEEKQFYEEKGYQAGLEQGISQGISQGMHNSIIHILSELGPIDDALLSKLQSIDEPDILKSLLIKATKASSLAEFQKEFN